MQYEAWTRSSTTDTNGGTPLHHHRQRRRCAGGAAARRAHLRSGQRPEDLRQRPLHRRRRPEQGRLARQLGQHLRAGARQRDHRRQQQWQGDDPASSPSTTARSPPAQMQQNFAAGVGPEVLPAVRREQLSGSPQSYILLHGQQYDNYSYLFYEPTFISLDRQRAAGQHPDRGHPHRHQRRAPAGRAVVLDREHHDRRLGLYGRERPAALERRLGDRRRPRRCAATCSSCRSTSSVISRTSTSSRSCRRTRRRPTTRRSRTSGVHLFARGQRRDVGGDRRADHRLGGRGALRRGGSSRCRRCRRSPPSLPRSRRRSRSWPAPTAASS